MVAIPEGLHGAHLRADIGRCLSPHALRSAVADRRLTVFSRSVLIDSKCAAAFHTRAAAALLSVGPDSVLSGQSSLALHGCAAAPRAPIHVVLPYFRRNRSPDGVVVHRGCIEEQDVEVVDGLRVLKLDVALAEVLCRADRRSAMACGDQALALHPAAERDEFRAWVEQRILDRSDPRGRRQALTLLDLATGLVESPMESWLLLALVDAGLPRPVPQFSITDLAGRQVYRLDFAWPDARIGGEYDGYEAHEHRLLQDAARDEDLRRRGWLVIRATVADMKDPSRLIAEFRSAFHQRGFRA